MIGQPRYPIVSPGVPEQLEQLALDTHHEIAELARVGAQQVGDMTPDPGYPIRDLAKPDSSGFYVDYTTRTQVGARVTADRRVMGIVDLQVAAAVLENDESLHVFNGIPSRKVPYANAAIREPFAPSVARVGLLFTRQTGGRPIGATNCAHVQPVVATTGLVAPYGDRGYIRPHGTNARPDRQDDIEKRIATEYAASLSLAGLVRATLSRTFGLSLPGNNQLSLLHADWARIAGIRPQIGEHFWTSGGHAYLRTLQRYALRQDGKPTTPPVEN